MEHDLAETLRNEAAILKLNGAAGSAAALNEIAERIDHLIYEAVAAERQRCAEKCNAIMRRHIDFVDRQKHEEDGTIKAAMALGAAECRESLSPYVVRDMSDEIARYPTFAEALVRYRELFERIRGRANIVNEDECDGATDGNQDGMTDEERGQL